MKHNSKSDTACRYKLLLLYESYLLYKYDFFNENLLGGMNCAINLN